MTKRFGKVGNIIVILLCAGVSFGCASGSGTVVPVKEQETIQGSMLVEEENIEKETVDRHPAEELDEQEEAGEYSPEKQIKENEERFYEEAENQGIDRQTAETFLETLVNDNIFRDGTMALTGLRIDDIDGNGQADMLVMVLDAQETPFYGSGGLWFYMNEDEPYCFSEESCSYCGWFKVFWEDIDQDDHVEIVFSAQGTGCGAVGDFYKAVFKYRNHSIEQMRLPSDLGIDYDCGLCVDVIQEPEADSYIAYCPYFDEQISFHAENVEGWDLPRTAMEVGGNVRGFYDLCVTEYEGGRMLQASEYLQGEGGTAHGVATAHFLITWEEDGTPKVVKWWIGSFPS